MTRNFSKVHFISAAMLLCLMVGSCYIPLSGRDGSVTSQINPLSPDELDPQAAGVPNLDVDYLVEYLDTVLFRFVNNSRDTNTEFSLDHLFYHDLTEDWGSLIGANDKYSYDNIMFYLGAYAMKVQEYTMEYFHQYVTESPLYSTTEHAYRVKMDQNGTSYEDNYNMVDNALALYAMLKYTSIDETGPSLNLWNYINDTLWHLDEDYTKSCFIAQNGSSYAYVYSFYNLLGALVNSAFARNPELKATSEAIAAAKVAQQAFSALNDTHYTTSSGGFKGFTKSTGSEERALKTNALAIATLADFYIQSGRAEANKSELQQAEDIYNAICNNLFDDSLGPLGAFMDSRTGVALAVESSLESNAYWLFALGRLFEASGNITYYEKGVEVYNQLVANLWDIENGGFNRSIGVFTNDSTKSVGDNAFLYYALQELNQAYFEMQFSLKVNTPNLVLFTDSVLNMTCQYNLTWARDYSAQPNPMQYTINQGIKEANVTFYLRYSNGTFIERIQNATNVSGNYTLLYNIPSNLPVGTYYIHAYANRTGFGTAYNSTTFYIIGNVSLTKVDDLIEVVQGETKGFNLTFQSNRNSSIMVVLNASGAGVTGTAHTFLLANQTTTEQRLNVTADTDTPLGEQQITVTLTNNSFDLIRVELTITVLPAVKFEFCEFSSKIVSGIDGVLAVTLQNARPSTPEAVNVTISSSSLQSITNRTVNLLGGQKIKIFFPLIYTDTFQVGSIEFEVNVTRLTQIVASNYFTCQLVSPIKIESVSTSTNVIQGRGFYLNVGGVNNINVSHTVDLYVNGKLHTAGITLTPGENAISLPFDPLTYNPWDMTTYTIDIEIRSEGTTIFQDSMSVKSAVSVENVLFFYALPLIFPVALVLIFLQRQKKRELLR